MGIAQNAFRNVAIREPQTARAAEKQKLLEVYNLPAEVIKRNCIRQTIDVDVYIGFTGPASECFPSWALLIHAGTGLAQISRQLCPLCDKGATSSNRAILRATHAAMRFAHNIALPVKLGNLARPLSVFVKSKYGIPFRVMPTPRRPHYALTKQIIALRACLISNGSVVIHTQEKRREHEGIRYATNLAHTLDKSGSQTVCLTCKIKLDNMKQLSQHFRDHHLTQKSCGVHSDCLKISELLEDKFLLSITGSGTPLSIS